jgi:hypothetical protein
MMGLAPKPLVDANIRVGGFIQKFGERWLHSWNVIGAAKELVRSKCGLVLHDNELVTYYFSVPSPS